MNLHLALKRRFGRLPARPDWCWTALSPNKAFETKTKPVFTVSSAFIFYFTYKHQFTRQRRREYVTCSFLHQLLGFVLVRGGKPPPTALRPQLHTHTHTHSTTVVLHKRWLEKERVKSGSFIVSAHDKTWLQETEEGDTSYCRPGQTWRRGIKRGRRSPNDVKDTTWRHSATVWLNIWGWGGLSSGCSFFPPLQTWLWCFIWSITRFLFFLSPKTWNILQTVNMCHTVPKFYSDIQRR